jgi:hypothetical protein
VRQLVPSSLHDRIKWVRLRLPRFADAALGMVDRIAPARRVARLFANQALFESIDLVVSTERTCLQLKKWLGAAAPRFAYVPHGAGDRNVAYHPGKAGFDLFLLGGQKLVDEMVGHGLAQPDQCRLIGYPKFDTVNLAATPRFFDNDRPVFVYNPHFDPHLSSWYDLGPDILRHFAANADRYNLIFAPHIMLFRKKLHISLEYRVARFRPEIPSACLEASNIHVDTSGPRLIDMSYMRAADAYIGDVSSQIYEFLYRPRACYFMDVHSGRARRPESSYPFWQNGDVLQSVDALADSLPDWQAAAARYEDAQKRLFAYTIDMNSGIPSSVRGAQAIRTYAGSLSRLRNPPPPQWQDPELTRLGKAWGPS